MMPMSITIFNNRRPVLRFMRLINLSEQPNKYVGPCPGSRTHLAGEPLSLCLEQALDCYLPTTAPIAYDKLSYNTPDLEVSLI